MSEKQAAMLEYFTCDYLICGDRDFGPDILFFSILEEREGECFLSDTDSRTVKVISHK